MRQTKKYVAAMKTYRKLSPGPMSPVVEDQARLYDWLARQQYAWDHKAGEWAKVERQVDSQGREKSSIFMNPDGAPSGVFRLRIMAHPDQVEQIAERLEDRLRDLFPVIESASAPYPNRKGVGSRVYMTLLFEGDRSRRKLRGRAAARNARRAVDVDDEEDRD